MPFVIKSHPLPLAPTRAPSVEFVEWAYDDANPSSGSKAAWFTAESSGGYGLYALGRISSDAEDAGKNAKGNKLVRFSADFLTFAPREPLGKADFQCLERIGHGSSIQNLNRCLCINSHVKVAEIDEETYEFLASRF